MGDLEEGKRYLPAVTWNFLPGMMPTAVRNEKAQISSDPGIPKL